MNGATPVAQHKVNPDFLGGFEAATLVLLSPDGRKIACAADPNTDGVVELFVSDASGTVPGGATRVSHDGATTANDLSATALQFGLSPDSSLIAYRNSAAAVELYLANPNDPSPVAVPVTARGATNDDVTSFVFSPGNSRLAYAGEITVDDEVDIYFVPITGGAAGAQVKVTNLPTDGDTATTTNDLLYWSRDSSTLFYFGDVATNNTAEAWKADNLGGVINRTRLHGTPTGSLLRLKVQD